MNKITSKEFFKKLNKLAAEIKQKVMLALQYLKEQGQALSPRLQKLATSALAGSLISAILFLNSCSLLNNVDVNNMDKVYSSDITDSMNVDDYNNKKEEFLNASTINLDADLQVVPENYYKQKFGLTDEQVAKQTISNYALCLEDALYICGIYYDESFLEDKLVLKTLFRYKLDPAIIQDLVTAYNDKSPIENSETLSKVDLLTSDEIYRRDRINNYNYRYLLNHIISTNEPEVVAENYDHNSILESKIGNVRLEDFKISTREVPMSSYKNGYHEIYFIGKRQYLDSNTDLDNFESLYYAYDDIEDSLNKTKNDIIISPFNKDIYTAGYRKKIYNKENIHNLGKILYRTNTYFMDNFEVKNMFNSELENNQ